MTRSRNGLLLALLVGLLLAGPVPGQAAAVTPTPAQLVQQLASESFEVREEAAQQLRKLGRASIPALQDGLKHADREVRVHCEELLQLARRSDLDVELEAFVLGQRDPKAGSLVGWNRLQDLAGNDLAARLLYVRLYRIDRPLLELLEKNPAQLGGQWLTRMQQLQQKFSAVPAGNVSATAEVNGIFLAGCLGNVDNNQFNQHLHFFYNQVVVTEVRQSPATRRLASRFLAKRSMDVNTLSQTSYLASYLGLHDVIDDSLKQAVRKHAVDAVKNEDLNRLQQIAYAANNLGMEDVVQGTIRPVLLKLAEKAAGGTDLNQMQQVASVAQVLQMQDVIERVLKPAASRHIQAAADHVSDMNRFYQARYLAQMTNQMDLFDSLMRPAAVRVISESADNLNDQNKFYTALQMAQMMHLEEAMEGVLRPAGRKMILASLEKAADWNEMNTAISTCQQLQMNDLLRDTVTPVFRKHARTLLSSNDVSRLYQVYHTCRRLQANEIIEEQLKPALKRYFASAKDQPLSPNFANQGLYLARVLQMKEAVPLALKAAVDKKGNVYSRGQAILFVSQQGTKEQAAELEPLLNDTTEVGSAGINMITLKAQVRDVVLAVLLQKNGQNPADYGFPYFKLLRGNKVTLGSPSYAGFAEDKERQAAFQKFKEWQQKQKK